jgi:acyl-coenzyme A synthetase/AMP-(fatty) acid ligase
VTVHSVYDPIAHLAVADPQRPAVILPRRRVSFGELDAMTARAALALREAGLKPGDRAGITLGRPLLHLVTALALARLQVCHMALPLSDPPLLRARTCRDVALAAVISEEPVPGLATIRPDPSWLDGSPGAGSPGPGKAADLPFLVLKSSGTTGEPKYADLTHADALARYHRFQRPFAVVAGDVFWPLSAIDYLLSKLRALYCLQAGAAVCLPAGLTAMTDIVAFARAAGASLAAATPSHMEVLLQLALPRDAIPSLRILEVTTATVTEQLRHRLRQAFGERLHVTYATNEAGTVTVATPEEQLQVPDTVGRVLPGVTLEIVNARDQPLPPGSIGQVRLRASGIARSYLGNPAASDKFFRNGWFYPGDLAALLPGGSLILHGRSDDMMICDGVNIYPSEIERVLLAHDAVHEAAAFPVSSQLHQQIPCAAVILSRPVPAQVLDAHCRERLGFKTPRRILVLDDYPRNAAGKVLKRELSKMAARSFSG